MRLDDAKVFPAGRRALLAVEKVVHDGPLEPLLLELVKLRASQINGCAWCVDMHTKDARALGEAEQRLHLVAVWREAPCFSPRERAALAWTEAVTTLRTDGVADDLYREATTQFSEEELAALTLAIGLINVWNRLNVAFRRPAGDYVSPHPAAHA